jgi:hypothetical protein
VALALTGLKPELTPVARRVQGSAKVDWVAVYKTYMRMELQTKKGQGIVLTWFLAWLNNAPGISNIESK